MGRSPCCDKTKVKRGPWSPEEDATLKNYLHKNGTASNWIALPAKAGLNRCGKSCRLRWLNYLRPDIKHGGFTVEEDDVICSLYNSIGIRWSVIAAQLPGRTDNDVKNYWNTKLKKKVLARSFSFNNNETINTNDFNLVHQFSSSIPIIETSVQDSETLPHLMDLSYVQRFQTPEQNLDPTSQFTCPKPSDVVTQFGTDASSLSSSTTSGLDHKLDSWSISSIFGGVNYEDDILVDLGFDPSNDVIVNGYEF
ncbi:hypothetical protein UlMin_022102 [Ulmus minor]